MLKKIHHKIKHKACHHYHKMMGVNFESKKIKIFFLSLFLVFCLSFTLFFYLLAKRLENSINFEPKILSVQQQKILKMISGFPMEKMGNKIIEKNPKVATYLVAIGKKESNWGMYSPKKDGRDCYNYWGYMGTYNQTKSGYSCFDSPEQAVDEVGERIQELLDQKIDTPREMVVWKCGSDCSVFSAGSVSDWINDVSYYYYELNKKRKIRPAALPPHPQNAPSAYLQAGR